MRLAANFSRRSAQSNGVNRDVGKLGLAQRNAEFCRASRVLRFAHDEKNSPHARGLVGEKRNPSCHPIVKLAARGAHLKLVYRVLNRVLIPREILPNIHRIVVSEYCSVSSRTHYGLRKNNPRLPDGRKKRLDTRARFYEQRNSERISPEIEVIDRLFDSVVEHVEVFLFEVQYELTISVASGNRRRNFSDPNSYRLLRRPSGLRGRTFRQICGRFLRNRVRRRMDWSGRFFLSVRRHCYREQRAKNDERNPTRSTPSNYHRHYCI